MTISQTKAKGRVLQDLKASDGRKPILHHNATVNTAHTNHTSGGQSDKVHSVHPVNRPAL